MNYKDFFSKLRSGELPRVLLLEGEEEYTKDSALHQIRRKILPEGLEELNETPLGAQSTAGEIVDACETLPFLSPLRLVVVRDSPLVLKTPGAARDDGLDRLLAYIANLPAHVFLVFFCRGKADRTRKVAARIDSLGGRVDFAPLDAKDKSIWLGRELKAHGKTMDRRAADLFLSRVDPLLTPTLQELQKVLAFVGDRAEIAEEDVEAVVAPTVEDRLFTFFDHLINGNAPGALTILQSMLQKKDAGTVQLLTPLTARIRQMLYYKLLKAKGLSDRELPALTGIRPNMIWLYEKQTRAFTEAQLRDLLDLCVEMDFAFKSGRISEEAALDRVVLPLLNRRTKK